MRKFMLISSLLFNIIHTAFAQKIPDGGRYRIHIGRVGVNIDAEILPASASSKADANRWYNWFAGGEIHQTQGGFSGHLLNGKYRSFFEDGAMKESGTFKAGLKIGLWQSWNSDGSLSQQLTYNDGVRDGRFVVYKPDGTVLQSGSYENDLLQGPVKSYHLADSSTVIWYEKGKQVNHRSLWKRMNVFKKLHRDTAAKDSQH